MKRTKLFIGSLLLLLLNMHDAVKAQYATNVFDFLPAPGQFTNTDIATNSSSDNVLGNTGGMVSLGSFGGYIIVGFDSPVVNDPQNPYGVDFSVEGNSFAGNMYGQWCEPGAVQVMKDLNKDGIPNDGKWYELAGSDYYLGTTQRNVTITYYNPHYSKGYTVPWKAHNGNYGALIANRFHTQPYYPDPFDFSTDIMDSVVFTGNRIQGAIDMSSPSYLNPYRAPAFGYCDSKGNNSPLTEPKNPYTGGTDGFDLGWAVDENGDHIDLDTVHFVRIYNAGFANIGWLGEWSTEVLGVAVTTPDPDYVPQDYYRNYIGITQLHVLKGQTCRYDGILFKNGRPQTEGTQHWWTSDPSVGTVDNEGNFTALELGETYLYFSQKDDIPADSIPIKVVELKSVVLEMEGNNSSLSSDSTSLLINEKIYIIGECEDNRTKVLNATVANRFIYEPLIWTTSNPAVGTIDNGLFTGTAPGRTMVHARSTSNPDLQDSIEVIVNPLPGVKPVKEHVKVPSFAAQGTYTSSGLFTTGIDAEIILNTAVPKGGTISASIEKNVFHYSFTSGDYTQDTVHFNITVFGQEHGFDIMFSYMPAVFPAGKQVIFTYKDDGGPQAIKSYFPEIDEIKTIATFSNDKTVKDMQVDGAFLFVATDQNLYRYNLSTYEAENMLEINYIPRKVFVYENRLFIAGTQDNVHRIYTYFKSDLSPHATIDLPAEATALTAMNDTVYALLDNTTGSALAILGAGVNTVSLDRTIDWGTDGINVSDIMAKDDTIFAIRRKSDIAPSAIISYHTGDGTHTVTEIAGVEFQSGNTSAVLEPMVGDTILLKNKRGFTPFDTRTLTLGTSTVMRDNTRYPAGAVYAPSEKRFYVAHTGSSDSNGTIFTPAFTLDKSFTGLGTAPGILRFCPELVENERPEITNAITGTSIVEGKTSMVLTVNKATGFSDVENDFKIYPKTTEPFLTWTRNGDNLRYSAFFDGKVENDSVITLEVEAVDHYGCATSSLFTLTIKPRIYTPRISTPLTNKTVAVNSGDLQLPLNDVFEFFSANVGARDVIEVQANSNPELVTTAIDETADTITLSFAGSNAGEAVLTLRGTTVETSPDDPENPQRKFIEFSFTAIVDDNTAPGSPAGLTGTPSETSIALSWTAPDDDVAVTGYNVYVNSEFNEAVTRTGYTVTGLDPETSYLLEVEAFDAAGNKSKKASVQQSTLVITGISPVVEDNITVYPNPFTGYLIIKAEKNGTAIMYNLSGKVVLNTHVQPGGDIIDVSKLPAGKYVLKYENKTFTMIKAK